MKIVLCHNFYQQPGGEDLSFAAEWRLLESHGHDVLPFTLHNDAIRTMGRWSVVRRTFWNRETYDRLRELIRRERPAIVHCTNTFPLLSPSAYYAAADEGVPTVQSLRNFRMFCCNALLLRDGRICEQCLGKPLGWPGVLHGCYRNSRPGSAVVAMLQTAHRFLRTWTRKVSMYFALTEFSRRKFIEGGLSARQIAVKPNFVAPDPGRGPGGGDYALFVGRLSPEKGIDVLLDAWQRPGMPRLKIVGDGPAADEVQRAAQTSPGIEWLSHRPQADVFSLLGDATCLVLPSRCYENFPRTIVEAFAKATPVVASRLGAMAEIVEHGRTGVHFTPGDADALASAVEELFAAPDRLATMREAARQEYERKYTAETNYRLLMAIYEAARRRRMP
jgi:glycosyltransferase involved in cell wall biosynthesis